MMKTKSVIILIALIMCMAFLTACNSGKAEEKIHYKEGIFDDKNWDETFLTYKGDAIPDKETAIAVATAVFGGMKKSQEEQTLKPIGVFFDTEDEVWIVTIGYPPDSLIAGGDYSIALQKSDGKVLRIWWYD